MKPTNLLRLVLITVTLSVLESTQLCSSAMADDAEDVLGTGTNDPIINLNPKGGARTTQGMAPDNGADGLGNSGGPVVDLDTNDGPGEPNESARNKPCPEASTLFAAALVRMGDNPCAQKSK